MVFDLKAAQQALSEKFGIPTFDIHGQVSTLPQTRPLDTRINVGVGNTGLDLKTFNDLISRFTPTAPTVPVQVVSSPNLGGTMIQPVSSKLVPGETVVIPSAPQGASFMDSLAKGFKDLSRTVGPAGLLVGIGVLALLVLKK